LADIIEQIRSAAALKRARIVLPEGFDPRAVKAASLLASSGLARPILLGDAEQIARNARQQGALMEGVQIVQPGQGAAMDDYDEEFYRLRRRKGVSIEEARQAMLDPTQFAAMMVHRGDADGFVGGCATVTARIVRACIQVIGTAPGIKTVSSCCVMVPPYRQAGVSEVVLFADTGVVPNPTAEQLADIAWSSAQSFRSFFGAEPYVAMISFSTKGSASHEIVEKVIAGTQIAQARWPEIRIDGELQVDAAVMPEVGRYKAPGSPVAGRANVLVFPDLNVGNTAYKLVERFGQARAYGPLLQGLAKPASDLSRGCSAEDIVDIAAFVAVQTQPPGAKR